MADFNIFQVLDLEQKEHTASQKNAQPNHFGVVNQPNIPIVEVDAATGKVRKQLLWGISKWGEGVW